MESVVAKVKELDWWEAYEQVKELLQERRTQYALVGGVVVALVAKRLLSSSKYNLPPGPRGLPLLGNMIGKYIVYVYYSVGGVCGCVCSLAPVVLQHAPTPLELGACYFSAILSVIDMLNINGHGYVMAY